MRWPANSSVLNTWLLAGILLLVAYMQISGAVQESKRGNKIDAFMEQGGRFTATDGDRLRRRIEMLEHRMEILEDVERQEHGSKVK